ncbi:ABC transporter-like protein [Methylophaga lonarensis MPL]|uniref:ABC transporter-like protein n=1 Tax=Methylophaga lonarensis MPL TaxID=1286106 RepID=M7NZV7_9GAMM|nr:ABC transporter ATP-binding protein [Methylophaga lonarensis]EMR12747.1 ABC transporter-like protein [Methylophaga lonarensis MPL]
MKRLSVDIRLQTPTQLDVQLTCEPGQMLALVGPSGSGKSTTLRCIAGLLKPHDGVIESGGHRWFDSHQTLSLSPQKRRVGIVFQDYALFPHLTVAGNIALALQADQDSSAQVDTLLEQVHLSGLASRYPAQLSGGQQQRVALARALARRPDVLLLDEPFSAVDRVTRRKLYLELHALRRQLSMPVILVTHDLDEAAMLADQMCVIHQGKTLQQGAIDEVLQRPKNLSVASQVDVRNLFEGELVQAGNSFKLRWHEHLFEVAQPSLSGNEWTEGEVHWLIAPAKILLHQQRRPSRGDQENAVNAVVEQIITLRGIATLLATVEGGHGQQLQLDVPEHVLQRNKITIGQKIGMSLLAQAIHIMPRSAKKEAGNHDKSGLA